MTQHQKPIPRLDELYANREPNELERRLAEQKAHPPAREYEQVIAHMPRSDPRRQAAMRALVNGVTPDYEKIWREYLES